MEQTLSSCERFLARSCSCSPSGPDRRQQQSNQKSGPNSSETRLEADGQPTQTTVEPGKAPVGPPPRDGVYRKEEMPLTGPPTREEMMKHGEALTIQQTQPYPPSGGTASSVMTATGTPSGPYPSCWPAKAMSSFSSRSRSRSEERAVGGGVVEFAMLPGVLLGIVLGQRGEEATTQTSKDNLCTAQTQRL